MESNVSFCIGTGFNQLATGSCRRIRGNRQALGSSSVSIDGFSRGSGMMSQRRRLAVLSEHMESRLVLSPVTMFAIHSGGPSADQDVAESPTDNSGASGDVDVVVQQEQGSAGDVVATEQSFGDNEVSAAPVVSSGTVSVALTETLSRADDASATDISMSKVTAVGSGIETSTERSRGGSCTELTNHENGASTQPTPVRSASSDTQQDVVPGPVDAQGREFADGVVVLDVAGRTVPVFTVSKVDSEQRDVAAMTVAAPDATWTSDQQQRSEVRRAVVTDAELQAQDADVKIVASHRIRNTDTATARSDNDVVLSVAVAAGQDHPATHVAGTTDTVVPVVSSETPQNDTRSGINNDQPAVDFTTVSDGDSQPVAAEMPLAPGSGTRNISSVTTEQPPDVSIEEANTSGGWLPDIAPSPEVYSEARLSVAITPNSALSLQWRSWLMRAEAPSETDADHERSECTHSFFGDATRVGLMLAAVKHAGRWSASVFSVIDSADELRGEGAPYSKERRRHRAATARRVPTTFDRLRQAINSRESVDEHNSLPNAHPSADAVFADAASMSLLYQNNFGSSHSERNGFLWSGLLLGGAGLVASRASRGRKIQPHRQLIPPSVSRNGGETLRFAD